MPRAFFPCNSVPSILFRPVYGLDSSRHRCFLRRVFITCFQGDAHRLRPYIRPRRSCGEPSPPASAINATKYQEPSCHQNTHPADPAARRAVAAEAEDAPDAATARPEAQHPRLPPKRKPHSSRKSSDSSPEKNPSPSVRPAWSASPAPEPPNRARPSPVPENAPPAAVPPACGVPK